MNTDSSKLRDTILKKYPNTKIQYDLDGNISIVVNGVDLMEEHLLPPTKDINEAWILADCSLRITQNINRTHPLRIEHHSSDDTKRRINKRKRGNFVDEFEMFHQELIQDDNNI